MLSLSQSPCYAARQPSSAASRSCCHARHICFRLPAHFARAPQQDRQSSALACNAAAAGRPKAAEVGPVCSKLLGLSDASWQDLKELVTPSEAGRAHISKVVGAFEKFMDNAALQSLRDECLSFELEDVSVQLVGRSAAGINLPQHLPAVALQLKLQACLLDVDEHERLLKKLAALMRAARHTINSTCSGVVKKRSAPVCSSVDIVRGEGLRCKFFNIPEIEPQPPVETAGKAFWVMLVSQPPTLPELMDANLTRDQRKLASLATLPALTEFLAQQPPLYKLAARVVNQWAEQCGPAFCKSREFGQMLDLLVLRAFEQYQVEGSGVGTEVQSTVAGDNLKESTLLDGAAAAAVTHQATLSECDADALDTILLNFLQCLTGLTPKTLISWDSLYSQETLIQVLADPRLGCVLRPGWTLHGSCTDTLGESSAGPLVLNPAAPTHNKAASVSVEQLTRFVNFGQKTLNDVQSSVMCDLRRRLLQQEMKVKRLQGKLDQQSSLMQVVLADSKGPAGS